MVDRIALDILGIIVIICAFSVITAIYHHQEEMIPTYYTVHQEGTELWLTPIQ